MAKSNQSIHVHRSERFVVTVKTPDGAFKLFQVGFSRSDGSFFVAYPYYRNTEGIVSIATLPAGVTRGIDIALEPTGKATSHLVKYSHHRKGEALFSQTGKVRSMVRRQSIPLEELNGHMFTVQLQGVGDFAEVDPARDRHGIGAKRGVLEFAIRRRSLEALKFVGWWHSADSLYSARTGSGIGPIAHRKNGQGKFVPGFLVSSPEGWPLDQHALLLTCEEIPLLTEGEQSCLTMIGGFDPGVITKDATKPTAFLAFSYPASDAQAVAARVGSIDLVS